STDAVTGGQLYSVNKQFATYFGGGAGYNEKGEWKAPTFKVKTVKNDGKEEDKTYQNVADALAGVGTSFTNVQNKITNEITNQINHLQSEDSAVVHYDKADDKNGTVNYGSITFGGKDQTLTALHNVADGVISSGSHDAINGKQINKIGEDIAKFLGGEASFKDGAFKGPTYKLSYIAKDGVVTASSLDGVGTALAGLDSNIKNVNQRIKEVSQGVAQDSLNWSKDANAFLAQHGDKEENSKITSLKGGVISSLSTDAINGSQLYALGSSVAQYFGGGASYENGAWSAPVFKFKAVKEDGVSIEDKEYSTVAEAFTGVGSSFEKLQKEFSQSITNITQEVQGDALMWSDADKAFSAQHGKDGAKTASKIKYLANGDISAASTEAITGSQLYGLGSNVAQYFGGGASYENGTWKAPTFTVKTVNGDGKEKENTYQNVAEAFEGVGTSITNVQNKVTNDITNKFNDFTKNITNITQQVQGDALLWSDTDNAFIADHKKDGTNTKSKITHLLDGNIASGSTDAVTGGQLYSLNEQLASYFGGGSGYGENGKWTAPTFKIKTVKEDGKSEDKTYSTVAEALAGVGNSFTNIKNDITNNITTVVSDSLVKWDEKTNLIKIGGEKYGNVVSIADQDSKDRTLSGVKAAEKDNEAVNKKQLEDSLKGLSKDLQSDDSAVVHYDKTNDESGTINYG
ncbi:hypothetical protein CER18_09540, partial [Bartonella tribocorum]